MIEVYRSSVGTMPGMAYRSIIRFSWTVLLLSLLLPAANAWAQKDFKLDESDNWELVSQPDPSSPAGALARARELLAKGEADRAYNMAYRWLERHGDSSLAADAYLLRADAMVAMGDYYESLYDYEYVIRRYPASPTFMLATTRELEIASLFANGTRRKVFGIRFGDATDEAEELFIRIQERTPGSQLAEQAGIELADMYFRQRRMELAADMYAIFIEKYPKSPFIDKARRRLIYANIATFKGPQFDIVGLREAKRELQQLIATRPAEAERIGAKALINRIIESEATKLLTTAEWYDTVGDPIAAEFFIRNMVERYPRTAATVRALDIIPGILAQLPESILASAPNYKMLKEGLVGFDRALLLDPPKVTIEGERPAAISQDRPIVLDGNTMPPERIQAAEALRKQINRTESSVDVPPGQPMPISPGADP